MAIETHEMWLPDGKNTVDGCWVRGLTLDGWRAVEALIGKALIVKNHSRYKTDEFSQAQVTVESVGYWFDFVKAVAALPAVLRGGSVGGGE